MFVQKSRRASPRSADTGAQRQGSAASSPCIEPTQLQQGQLAERLNSSPRMIAQRKMTRQLLSDRGQQNPRRTTLSDGGQDIAQLKEASVKPNNTGLPDQLKSGIESLSGMSMDQVKVHRNSSKPEQLNAHAYAQGTDIHVAPGQEKHLPHEAWHVVQQAQGRVKPTRQMKRGAAVNDDRSLEHEADVMGAKAASQGAMSKASSQAPAQLVATDKVVQCTLLPLESFKAQFANDEERRTSTEYHAQICDDLENYHKGEYDVDKEPNNELELKFEYRKMTLLSLRESCGRWLGLLKKRPTGFNPVPWDAVYNLWKESDAEYQKYYNRGEKGRGALRDELYRRQGQKEEGMFSVDEFKDDANLGIVGANIGEMGAVVSKLKAFHAIKEVASDDSTRVAKLATLDALSDLTEAAIESLQDLRKSDTYKASYLDMWKDWCSSRLRALKRLSHMLAANRARFEDPVEWRLNLQNVHFRNEDAKAGRGVSMTDVESDWVDVDDGDQSNAMAAETADILKRLAPDATGG
jgi:hypothetical protein